MTQAVDWDMAFQPTPDMVERHSNNVACMVEAAQIEVGPEAAERVERAWASIASQPWMAIDHAVARVVEWDFAHPDTVGPSDLLAVRTYASLSPGCLLDAVARVIGITTARARQYLPPDGRYLRDLAGKTFLYRYYDDVGDLLYVGITNDLAQREAWHRSNSRWFGEQNNRTVEVFPTRSDALAAERAAIRLEFPAFNKQGVPRSRRCAVTVGGVTAREGAI